MPHVHIHAQPSHSLTLQAHHPLTLSLHTHTAFTHTLLGWVADEQLDLGRHTGTELAVPAFAGFATGVLYKSTSTPRAALLAGCIGMVASCVYGLGGSYVYNSLFGKRGGRY